MPDLKKTEPAAPILGCRRWMIELGFADFAGAEPLGLCG